MSRAPSLALIYQPYRSETRVLANEALDYLAKRSIAATMLGAFDLSQALPSDFTLAVTFGGDGTVLRAAAWLLGSGVPVVPVRMGTLSFLGELLPVDFPGVLEDLAQERFRIEERAMLEARSGTMRAVGLNDVIIGRGAASRAVRLQVYVDNVPLARYTADGLVVATPTGSTAYALAAGGPVLAPSLPAIVLVPIAPHLSHLRAIALPQEVKLRITVNSPLTAVLTVDGHMDTPVDDGAEVQIQVATETTRFARLRSESDFYKSLDARLSGQR